MNHITILIIEDNENLSDLYQMAFSRKGYEVLKAHDGLEGITLAAKEKPKVILLDLMMPSMDGFEVLEALRNNTSLETAVFVTSNLNGTKNIEKAIAGGATDFLRKTENTPQEIVEKIEKYIKSNYQKETVDKLKKFRKKVLIIEDNSDQADLLSLGLQQKNFQVDVACDGIEGITKAIETKPDLILLDIMLPDMDGFEVLESLNSSNVSIPIIITSQIESSDKIRKATNLGAVDFVKKVEYTPGQIAEKVIDYFEIE